MNDQVFEDYELPKKMIVVDLDKEYQYVSHQEVGFEK